MMKKILFLFLGIFFSTTLFAQNIPEDLLDIAKYRQNQNKPYQGGTFVHIDLPQLENKEKKFIPAPLKLDGTYAIKTPFGQETTAAFIPHTTDFSSIIQILGDGSIILSQTIQLVNTQKDFSFSQIFENETEVEFSLIEAKLNNEPRQTITLTKTPSAWVIKDSSSLSSGIYTYTLSYLIKGAIVQGDKKILLNLSLTGNNWHLPVERFSAIVLFPMNAQFIHRKLVFGANNVEIPQAVQEQLDAQGNIAYTLKQPLPAYADVKLDILFNQNSLISPSFFDKLEKSLNHLLFLLCLSVLCIYTLITKFYLKYFKFSKFPIRELKYYSLISIRYMVNHPITYDFLSNLMSYYSYIKRSEKTICFWQKVFRKKKESHLIKFYIFFNVMRKYLLTMSIIIILTLIHAYNTGFALNVGEGIVLFIIMLLLNIWLFKTAEKPYIKKMTKTLINSLLYTDIGFGIGKTSLKALYLRFYPYTLALDIQTEWDKLIHSYGLNITEFSFYHKEETK